MVVLSLTLNVIALCLPFMDMRRGLSTEPYSLWASVRLLWESDLFVLAIVVVGFSMVFPFVKLAVMCSVLLGLVRAEQERPWLEFVERFGKWSMLDVFLVSILLALANDQFWIEGTPQAGLMCFALAIVASMLTSRHMLARVGESTTPSRTLLRHPLRLALWQIALLILLIAAISVPYLEIDDWLLEDHPVSILSTISGLWNSGARGLSLTMLLFLVVAPLLASIAGLVLIQRSMRGRSIAALREFVTRMRHWAMLDVFSLALVIFMIEGREFVRTDLTWGALLLAVLLALYWPAASWYERHV